MSNKIYTHQEFLDAVRRGLRFMEDSLNVKETPEAVDIITMVAMHESMGLAYDRQIGGGPARSVFQIEIPTYLDIFENYLKYRPDMYNELRNHFSDLQWVSDGAPGEIEVPCADSLVSNLEFGVVMCRIYFLRKPEAFPKHTDKDYLWELAKYCKKHYNTHGKATAEEYLNDYKVHWLGEVTQ